MLWNAPELLRAPTKNKPTREGDIYSVGIIMQEVVMRGPPFENECRDTDNVKGQPWSLIICPIISCLDWLK